MNIRGIHHITVLASDPQRNVDFYAGFLGLRLVKQTVNFDAPDVYHLYYADNVGTPGTVITFFPFPNAARGMHGVGETSAVAFSIPEGSLEYWIDRLAAKAVHFDGPFKRFDEDVISFEDHDGLTIELISDSLVKDIPSEKRSDVDSEHAIRKLHGATIVERSLNPSSTFFSDTLGLKVGSSNGNRHRYETKNNDARMDIVVHPSMPSGKQSAGSVHHIAWRVSDDEEQLKCRDKLVTTGVNVTRVRDRNYFHSVYFREPGGVLCEIATDTPGFAVDETIEELGTRLKLPDWLEPRRASIERILPPLRFPHGPGWGGH